MLFELLSAEFNCCGCAKFDERRADLPLSDITTESLRDFVSKHQLPMVAEFTQEAAEKLLGGAQKHHLLFFVSKTSTDFPSLLDVYQQAAPKFQGKVSFDFNGYVFFISSVAV